jgi:hypothetical protein
MEQPFKLNRFMQLSDCPINTGGVQKQHFLRLLPGVQVEWRIMAFGLET